MAGAVKLFLVMALLLIADQCDALSISSPRLHHSLTKRMSQNIWIQKAVEIGLEELTNLNTIKCPTSSDVVKNLTQGSIINSTVFSVVSTPTVSIVNGTNVTTSDVNIDFPAIDRSQMNVAISIPAIDSPTVSDHGTTSCIHVPEGGFSILINFIFFSARD